MFRKIVALMCAAGVLLVMIAPVGAGTESLGAECDPLRSGANDKVWKSDMHVTSGRFKQLTMTFDRNLLHTESKYSGFGIYLGNNGASNPYDMDVGMEFLYELDGTYTRRGWIENSSGVNADFYEVNDSTPDWSGTEKYTITHDSIGGFENYHLIYSIDGLPPVERGFYSLLNGVDATYATIGFYGNFGSQFLGRSLEKTNATSMLYSLTSQSDPPTLVWDRTTDRDDWGVESVGAWTSPAGEDFWDQNCT